MYADLHVHTYYSDGLVSPKDIFRMAKEKGLHTVAITDHDTIYHLDECQKYADMYGVNFLRAVELSCYNFEKGKKIHIVGLNINEEATNVERLGNQVLEGRNNYHKKMLDILAADGYEVDFKDAKAQSHSGTVFKMHLYLAIKEKYPEIDDAFYKKYFLCKDTTDVDLEMGYIDIEEGIQAILKDGGTPILAHPNLYDSFPEVEEYVGYGLKGIEKSHYIMNQNDIERSIALADKYNLVLSGGSDFHILNDAGEHTIGDYGLVKEDYVRLMESL